MTANIQSFCFDFTSFDTFEPTFLEAQREYSFAESNDFPPPENLPNWVNVFFNKGLSQFQQRNNLFFGRTPHLHAQIYRVFWHVHIYSTQILHSLERKSRHTITFLASRAKSQAYLLRHKQIFSWLILPIIQETYPHIRLKITTISALGAIRTEATFTKPDTSETPPSAPQDQHE